MTASSRSPARVRFAPSPTGRLHLGGARTALYNYLLARQTGGQFILRIEDTDQKRLDPAAEAELIDGLHWLGLSWDEGPDAGGPFAPYRQSERKDLYQETAQKLVGSGSAYACFCSPTRLADLRNEQQRSHLPVRYDGRCRRMAAGEAADRIKAGETHVIRFKMPAEGEITVVDRLRGGITFENKNLDDYILVKSDGLALYHLAAMVDDHEMGITHVLRSSEWLPTLPLHAHIYRALGWVEPEWVHLSVFLKPSGKGKMSKREAAEAQKGGHSIYITDLRELGFIPEAVVNWMALMGWSYDDQTEFFTLPDLVEKFDLDRLNPAAAAINFTKFDHFNGLHIRQLETSDLASRLRPFYLADGIPVNDSLLLKIVPLIRERIVTLDEAPQISGFFFRESLEINPEQLVGKALNVQESRAILSSAQTVLEEVEDFTAASLESRLRSLVEDLQEDARQVFGILRVAVTGQQVSPPLFESMEIIGRHRVLERVIEAQNLLAQLDGP